MQLTMHGECSRR